jgi:hypothetical protein
VIILLVFYDAVYKSLVQFNAVQQRKMDTCLHCDKRIRNTDTAIPDKPQLPLSETDHCLAVQTDLIRSDRDQNIIISVLIF